MLAETRPPLRRILANVDFASAKVSPAIEKADLTLDNATALTKNLNQVVLENRAEIHEVLLNLRAALVDARRMVVNLDDSLQGNRDSLDETIENIRVTAQNLSSSATRSSNALIA